MSPQKLQQLDCPASLRGLQRLVQLSNTTLGRTVTTALTQYQLMIIGIVFIVMLIMAIRKDVGWATVNREVAIEFFSAVSQSLAALLGFLIVFLTFTSQLIAQQRIDDYRVLQTQTDQLIELTQTLPSELSDFDETLVNLINYLVPLQMKDFPIWASTLNHEQEPILEQLLADFQQKWTEEQHLLSFATRLHLQQILLVLNNMQEILEGFLTIYDRILQMGRFILAIVKMSFLLGVSLLCLLLFSIVKLQETFLDFSLPIIVTLGIWVLITLFELVMNTWFLYTTLHGPWSHSIHYWYSNPNKTR